MGFCPQCGSEWREGIAECKDCGVTLSPELPAEFQEPIREKTKLSEHLGSEDWHLPEIDANERMRLLAWLLAAFLIGYYLILVVHSEYSSIIDRGQTNKGVVDRVFSIVSAVSLDTLLIVSFLLLAILLAMFDTERRHGIIRATQYLAFLYASLFTVTSVLRFFYFLVRHLFERPLRIRA
jgi:hypothetical protein